MNNKIAVMSAVCIIALCACSQNQENATTSQPGTTESTTETTTTSAPSESTGATSVYQGSITGVISDSMCGRDHSGMGDLGKDPVACTNKCVEKGAKYVLVDEKGNVYNLSGQDKARALAGRTVSISGHIDPQEKAIHVHSITAQ